MSITWDGITALQSELREASTPEARDKAEFKLSYALARHIGERRFGAECTHDKQVNGYCVACLRKVR